MDKNGTAAALRGTTALNSIASLAVPAATTPVVRTDAGLHPTPPQDGLASLIGQPQAAARHRPDGHRCFPLQRCALQTRQPHAGPAQPLRQLQLAACPLKPSCPPFNRMLLVPHGVCRAECGVWLAGWRARNRSGTRPTANTCYRRFPGQFLTHSADLKTTPGHTSSVHTCLGLKVGVAWDPVSCGCMTSWDSTG